MAFLKLNGWTLPVAQAQEDTLELGTHERAFSGAMRRTRWGLKRQWSITTAELLQSDAIALEGLLLAQGEQFRGELDTFSAKGMASLQDNGISTVIGQGKYGNAWWPRGAFTNLLAENIATGTDLLGTTAGFGVSSLNGGYNAAEGGGTITSSTALPWQGTRSVYVSLLSGGLHFGGVYTVATVAPNTQYTFSCYVRGEAAATLQLYVYGPNNAGVTINSSTAPFGVTSSAWVRPTLTFTTGAGVTSVRLIMGEYADNGYKFYTDGWLLEPGSAASPFSVSFAGVNLGYYVARHFSNGAEGLSISGWAINPTVGGVIGALTGTGQGAIKLYYSAANVLRARITSDTGTTQDVASSWSTPTTWAMWTLILTRSGSPNAWLCKNGVAIATATIASVPDMSALTTFYLGNLNGASQWGGYLDEVMLYPFAPSPAMLAGLASMTASPPIQPQLTLDGDIVGGLATTVLSSEVKTTYSEGRKSAGWRSNLARVQFTLTEA